MGSGKTTLGQQLAEILHRPFFDLDRMIEEQQRKTISEIFQHDGENKFRELESNKLHDLVFQPPSVIALGGGTVCFRENLQLVKTRGLLLYISVPADELVTRLEHFADKRPLLVGKKGDALRRHVFELLNKRLPFYNEARITVEGPAINAQQIYRAILDSN
jgi:shikimate kinase